MHGKKKRKKEETKEMNEHEDRKRESDPTCKMKRAVLAQKPKGNIVRGGGQKETKQNQVKYNDTI